MTIPFFRQISVLRGSPLANRRRAFGFEVTKSEFENLFSNFSQFKLFYLILHLPRKLKDNNPQVSA